MFARLKNFLFPSPHPYNNMPQPPSSAPQPQPGTPDSDSEETQPMPLPPLHDLIAQTHDSTAPTARKEAAEALGKIADARAVAPLARLLHDRDKDVRFAAAHALAQYGNFALPVLAESLEAKRAQTRIVAIFALGTILSKQAIKLVVTLAADPSVAVREQVVEALVGSDDKRAIVILLRLRADPALGVRIRAQRALLPHVATDTFVRALKNGDDTTRVAAACVLAYSDKEAALDALFAVTTIPSHQRYDVLQVFQTHPDPRAVGVMLGWFNDPSKWLRARVAQTLVKYADDTADLLHIALSDDSPLVRQTAAMALGLRTDGEAVEPLLDLMADGDPHVRRAATLALGQRGGPRAIEPIFIMALSDPSTYARRDAAHALGNIKDPAAVNALIAVLADPVPIVRRVAAASLGRQRDQTARDALTAATHDPNEKVRRVASHALLQLR